MTLLDTFFNGQVMLSSLPALMRGFLNTLLLGLLSIGIGMPAGLLISLVRLYAPKPLRWLAIGYIDIFRAHAGAGRAHPDLLRPALRRHPPVVLGFGGDGVLDRHRRPTRRRCSAPASRASRRASSRPRRRSACRSC